MFQMSEDRGANGEDRRDEHDRNDELGIKIEAACQA